MQEIQLQQQQLLGFNQLSAEQFKQLQQANHAQHFKFEHHTVGAKVSVKTLDPA